MPSPSEQATIERRAKRAAAKLRRETDIAEKIKMRQVLRQMAEAEHASQRATNERLGRDAPIRAMLTDDRAAVWSDYWYWSGQLERKRGKRENGVWLRGGWTIDSRGYDPRES